MWRLVSASEQTQLLQLPDHCSFLQMLSMIMQWLSLLVRQRKRRALARIPALSVKMIPGGWPRVLQGRCCHSFLPHFQPELFSLACHTVQTRKLSLPMWTEDTKQNLLDSTDGSEILFLHYIKTCHFKMCCCFSPSPSFL